MFANLFGKYLVSQGILSEDDFLAAKMLLNKTRVKLGLIAVSEKLMTEKDADKVNFRQQVIDKKFGDIAVEMGLLSRAQVERLLALQGNPYMQFCQCLVDKELMKLSEIEEALTKFQKDNGFTQTDMEAIKSDDLDRIVPLFIPTIPDGPLYDLLGVTFRCINRLASEDICIEKGYITSNYKTGAIAMQDVFGDYEVTMAFTGDDKGILAIAEAFAKEFFNEVDINALDSVGEFINISDGLFATAKSREGMELNLRPPVLSKEPMELSSSTILVIPVEINEQKLDWLIIL